MFQQDSESSLLTEMLDLQCFHFPPMFLQILFCLCLQLLGQRVRKRLLYVQFFLCDDFVYCTTDAEIDIKALTIMTL